VNCGVVRQGQTENGGCRGAGPPLKSKCKLKNMRRHGDINIDTPFALQQKLATESFDE
jgi:hypothetical protein